jgi:hypothetical protein
MNYPITHLSKRLETTIEAIGELMTVKQRAQETINNATGDIAELTTRKTELEDAIELLKGATNETRTS